MNLDWANLVPTERLVQHFLKDGSILFFAFLRIRTARYFESSLSLYSFLFLIFVLENHQRFFIQSHPPGHGWLLAAKLAPQKL